MSNHSTHPSEQEKISIKKISEIAGVSVATVSRVINGNGRFSAETEQRVLQIIKEYNYRPNMIAKGLRTNVSKSVGIIIPDITNEFFSSIVRELEMLLFQRGYTAFICNTDESEEIENKYYSALCSKGVDGLIYLSGKVSKDGHLSKVPTIFIDRSIQMEQKNIVIESDNYQGGILATQELLSKGCRRIVLIRDERQISTIQDRYRGYRAALEAAGIELLDELILRVYPISYQAAKDGLKTWIREGKHFDGIFATTDWMALGAIDALREAGFQIPNQVKVVGFDNISISRFSALPITTISQDFRKMAEEAVELLIRMMSGESPEIRTYHTPVTLVRRESC